MERIMRKIEQAIFNIETKSHEYRTTVVHVSNEKESAGRNLIGSPLLPRPHSVNGFLPST
jgi:hypothetical protein